MHREPTDFQTAVIERSRQTPVLVDFWAPWCGPCKMLGPVLENLAAQAGSRWTLVKIDTDERQDLAAQFGIRSIPSLKLFHHGAVIAELAGALPEPALRQWLDEHLPTPKRDAMGRARMLLHSGEAAAAAKILEPLQAAQPDDLELAVLLGRALVFSAPVRAAALVEPALRDTPWQDGARIVTAFAHAFASLASPDRLPAAGLRDRYLAALGALRRQDFPAAAAGLVDVLLEKPNYDEGRARAACLALFQHLGPRHAITEEFFRRYSMAVNI